MTFSLFDLLLILIFSQGLFLLVAIQLMPNKNKEANIALTFVLLIASIMLLGRVLIYYVENDFMIRIGAIIDTSIYLFGPFLYLYIRRLAFNERKVFTLCWQHFILAGLYFCYFLWNLFVDLDVLKEFHSSKNAHYLYLLVELSGAFSISFYLFKSFKLYKVFKRNQASEVSFDQQLSTYLILLILALTCFVALWFISIISYYGFKTSLFFINYDSMWISSALLMYLIGFYSLTRPHIFRVSIQRESMDSSQKNRMKSSEIVHLQQSIGEAFDDKKVYLEPTLSLVNLAKRLNTTSNNLSWVLNNIYNKTFYEFVNEYRIADFINKIKLGRHKQLTLFSIALEVGFNSKSTFNKAFKSTTNETPSKFIKNLENQ